MVTAAATRIGDLGVDVRISWIWAFVKQRHNAHDHARLAIATLWYVEIDPGELHECIPSGDRPSMVVTALPTAVETGTLQERTGRSSMCRVQAPH
jgi:hypothetical protein